MLIKNLLKKYPTNDYFFARYYENGKVHYSLLVTIDPIDCYDITRNKIVSKFGVEYKKPLIEYVNIQEREIRVFMAKREAKPYFAEFDKYVDEQLELDYPNRFRLKTKVDHSDHKNDIVID